MTTLYQEVLCPARDAADGETPTCIEVIPCDGNYLIVLNSTEGRWVMRYFRSRDAAIRAAVMLAEEYRRVDSGEGISDLGFCERRGALELT